MKKNKPTTDKATVHKLKNFPDDLQEIWDIAGPDENEPSLVTEQETEQALNDILTTIDVNKKTSSNIQLFKYFAVAATVLIAAFVSYISFYSYSYQAAPGEQLTVSLPDGSRVQLNGNTSLSYRPFFGTFHRNMDLDGEAYFEVVSSETPFVVNAPTTQTTVLGTKFNVSDWNNSSSLNAEVSVLEGKVSVYDYHESDVFIIKNESATLNRNTRELSKQQVSEISIHSLSWLNGDLKFSNVTLAQFFERLEFHFGKEIILKGDLFDRERIQAHYKNSTELESILTDISTIKNLSVQKTSSGFIVSE